MIVHKNHYLYLIPIMYCCWR